MNSRVNNSTRHAIARSISLLVHGSMQLFPKLHSNSCDYLHIKAFNCLERFFDRFSKEEPLSLSCERYSLFSVSLSV